MPSYNFTDKQKRMLQSIEPLTANDGITAFYAIRGDDRVTVMSAGNNRSDTSWRSAWENVTESDLTKFCSVGILHRENRDYYSLDAGLITKLVKTNFVDEEPIITPVFSNNTFTNSIINAGSYLEHSTQNINAILSWTEEQKAEMSRLFDELKSVLVATPNGEDKEAVEKFASDLLSEVGKTKPNNTILKLTSDGLREAAKTVAVVTPSVLTAATAILTFVARFIK